MSNIGSMAIVLSSDQAVIVEAERAGLAVLDIGVEECSVRIGDEPGSVGPGEPSEAFMLRRAGKANYTDWYSLAAWLSQLLFEAGGGSTFDGKGILLVDIKHPWREFILYLSKVHGVRFSLIQAGNVPPIRAIEYALLCNAEYQIFLSEELVSDYKRSSIYPIKSYVGFDTVSSDRIDEGATASNDRRSATQLKSKQRPSARKSRSKKEKPIRLLVVAYFSGECSTVGVVRANYWFEELERLSNGKIEVELVSAVRWAADTPGAHFVPDHYIASLIDGLGEMEPWAHAAVENEQKNAKSFNTLSHYWRFAVERYFDQIDTSYDVVLISGNPFSCFDFASYAKRKWNARVVLDYRDPFANNSRIEFSDDHRKHAQYIEAGFNMQADLLLTVNTNCLDYFELKDEVPGCVIENGYDERALDGVQSVEHEKSKINVVHAGSFYHDRSPGALISEIDKSGEFAFHHVGGTNGIPEEFLDNKSVLLHGRREYEETLGLLSGGDVGVVFISPTGFETTTKIYDYLAVGLDILICTHGKLRGGALASMVEGMDGVYWCKNSPRSISNFLRRYRPERSERKGANMKFSREYQTRILVDKILELAPKTRGPASH